jgi:hypothetical protein
LNEDFALVYEEEIGRKAIGSFIGSRILND